jgi:tRNA A37 methylthiotransferase MiaB
MVEEAGKENKGRLESNTLVHFASDKTLRLGDMVKVRITEAKTFYLIGNT